MFIWAPRTVTAKLNVYIGAATCALLILTVWVSYYTGGKMVEAQTNAEAMRQVHSLARYLDEFVSRMAETPNRIAEHRQYNGSEASRGMITYLASVLSQTPLEEAHSVYIAYEHRQWTENDAMLRVDRQSWPRASPVGYDYHDPKYEWYSGPRSTGEAYISEPFFFDTAGSKIILVSVSKPV